MGQAKRRTTKIQPKAIGGGIFVRVSNYTEVAGEVISDAAVDYFSMDVCATFGESGLNSGRIIRLFGWHYDLRITFVQYLTAFCSRPEATMHVST